jgi:hypothetical protein
MIKPKEEKRDKKKNQMDVLIDKPSDLRPVKRKAKND